jgi:hypothetical protein
MMQAEVVVRQPRDAQRPTGEEGQNYVGKGRPFPLDLCDSTVRRERFGDHSLLDIVTRSLGSFTQGGHVLGPVSGGRLNEASFHYLPYPVGAFRQHEDEASAKRVRATSVKLV